VVDQKLFTLEQVRTVLVLQGLRLKVPKLFWIQICRSRATYSIFLHSVGDGSQTVSRLTQKPPRIYEFSERGRTWTLDGAVQGEDWAFFCLYENAPLHMLGSGDAEAESSMLVTHTNHMFGTGNILISITRQYLLNLRRRHRPKAFNFLTVTHRTDLTGHFLTNRRLWERVLVVDAAAVGGYLGDI
jgi:hypothetical protein